MISFITVFRPNLTPKGRPTKQNQTKQKTERRQRNGKQIDKKMGKKSIEQRSIRTSSRRERVADAQQTNRIDGKVISLLKGRFKGA